MPNAAPATRAHVLIVEDDKDAREIYEATLAWAGYRVTTTATAAEARRVAASGRHDLAIVHATLPDGSGVALLRAWKALPATAATPVVVVTAFPEDADAEAARRAGVDALLVKPCWGVVLTDTLAGILDPRRSTKKMARYRSGTVAVYRGKP